jgi:membrane-bound lytic murein transglycosylase B
MYTARVKFIVAGLLVAGMATAMTSASSPAASLQAAPESAAPSDTPHPSFEQFLDGVRSEAEARGIRKDILDQALAGIDEPMPVVLERDRTQAETVLPLEAYIKRQVTPQRIRTGRTMVSRHSATLNKVARTYGVPAGIIGGIWGIESNYGRFSGVRPTIAALATLAWDPRRSTYFRGELFNALEILNRGDIDLPTLKGSWAGAMGQPQFMPSSYLEFAQDFDGDGRRDIWKTEGDIFASIANYLKGHGWVEGELWGREVTVSKAAASKIAATVAARQGTCRATRDMTAALPLREWQALGVRRLGGGALPRADMQASLVSGGTRHFLVYRNYDALLDYNCAHAYALSVALLGERLQASASGGGR